MRTLRDMVVTAVVGVINQGKPAFSVGQGTCVYRDNSGNKCAVGQLIPDDKYTPEMEGYQIESNFRVRKALNIDEYSDESRVLNRIQNSHDSAAGAGDQDNAGFIDQFCRSASYVINDEFGEDDRAYIIDKIGSPLIVSMPNLHG